MMPTTRSGKSTTTAPTPSTSSSTTTTSAMAAVGDLQLQFTREKAKQNKMQNELDLQESFLDGEENAATVKEIRVVMKELRDAIIDQDLVLAEIEHSIRVATPVASSTLCQEDPEPTARIEKLLARQIISAKLPKYDGDPVKWKSFISCFERTSTQLHLTDEENLNRLQAALDGAARQHVRHMLDDPARLGEVIDTLTRRFGDKTVVLRRAVQSIEVAKMPDINIPQTILDFAEAVGDLRATMSPDAAPGNEDHLLMVIERKLSPFLMTHWRTHCTMKQQEPSTAMFQIWINELADHSWKSLTLGTGAEERSAGKPKEPGMKGRVSAVDVKNRVRTCFACRKTGHFVSACEKFQQMTVAERLATVRANNMCANCLFAGHRVEVCRNKTVCTMVNCGARHHTLLHAAQIPVTNTITTSWACGYAPVMPVHVTGPYGTQKVFALIDTGSNATFIDPSVAAQIGAFGPRQVMHVDGYYAKANHVATNVVNVTVSAVTGGKTYELRDILSATVPLGECLLDAAAIKAEYPYAANVDIASFHETPKLLIGSAHTYVTEPQQVVARHPGEPRFYKSKLGWYIMGPKTGENIKASTCHVHTNDSQTYLRDVVQRHLFYDDIGVRERPRLPGVENERADEIMAKTYKRTNPQTIEIGLLWRHDNIAMPDSYQTALTRLQCIERKMARDSGYAEAVRAKIADYLEKGYWAKSAHVYGQQTSPRDWYIPVFGVYNKNKPGKIRLVADCAAETKGVSLNKMLLSGPDLNNSLVGTLMRFRRFRHAVVADVEEMYHRVHIRPEDWCAQRVLWRDGDSTRQPDIYEYRVMTFGATCSPTCAQYVKNRNADEHASDYPDASNAIKEQFYVDDYLDCFATVTEAVKITREVIKVQLNAGYKTTRWLSNSPAVLDGLTDEFLSPKAAKLLTGGDERVLGILWNPVGDIFQIVGRAENDFNDITTPTKREALASVMSVYDPLGLASLVTIRGKIVLQQAWRAGIEWEDLLPEDIREGWRCFRISLQMLREVPIPRMYCSTDLTTAHRELHIFCDASESAYAAVVYVRVTTTETVECSLVFGKARVASIKPTTIPRLELQAALLGARVGNYVRDELKIPFQRCTYWSDSTTALAWITSQTRRFGTYVSNRVAEILDRSEPSAWRWVPTLYNPADLATRCVPVSSIPAAWFHGPEYLRQPEAEWPKKISNICTTEELHPRVNVIRAASRLTINASRFSRLTTLLRVTACVTRPLGTRGPFSAEDIDKSLLYLVKMSQADSFAKEIERVQNQQAPKGKLKAIETYMEDGYLRVQTRLRNADYLPHDTRYPYILDGRHPFTRLLIHSIHCRRGHQGKETVRYEMRKRFHVIAANSAVKTIARTCQWCITRRSLPKPPRMADLPDYRLQQKVHPFQFCGMDYFGPFYVKIGRRKEKRWGAIFTCLSTRAVHLEIAATLSADSALQAIQRMSNRRGAPKTIFCDNGTNFHGAETELLLMRKQTEKAAEQRGIQFHFIPPSAPHMGGVWERLVRSVKTVLGGILFDHAVTDETAYTLFTEAEWTLNTRPLTPVSADPNDQLPLTPNHFLLTWRSGTRGAPLHPQEMFDVTDDDLYRRRQWKTAQRLADIFWQRWVKEFLPQISHRGKWTRESPPVREGDVVLIVDSNAPRNEWRRGVIIRNYPGRDGIARVADVKTEKGILRRPMTKLCCIVKGEQQEVINEEDIRADGSS